MTPAEWYNIKRNEFKSRYNRDWAHRAMFGDHQDSDVCETAMRAGIECRFFKPTSSEEIEMIANAVMIRDLLKQRLNYY